MQTVSPLAHRLGRACDRNVRHSTKGIVAVAAYRALVVTCAELVQAQEGHDVVADDK